MKYEYVKSDSLYTQMVCYPLTVLGTNRVLDTVISRKPSPSLVSDFRDLWRIGGIRALYSGFLPYFLAG